MNPTSKTLLIFEGPDGSGKTTAALVAAKTLNARYVHFSNLPRVKASLWRLYYEAMLPAVLGYQAVVLDRCWLSEPIYGRIFRGGLDRMGVIRRRHLERLALRCAAQVVVCLPPERLVRSNLAARAKQAKLDHVGATPVLRHVGRLWAAYAHSLCHQTCLPVCYYDYTADEPLAYDVTSLLHPLGVASAGALNASVVLVGEAFGERKDGDPLFQWPFAGFNRSGCAWWLTAQLEAFGLSERDILWVNQDQLTPALVKLFNPGAHVVALGTPAANKLERLGVPHAAVSHPQYWKRFYARQPYPLIKFLRRYFRGRH